MGWQTLEPHRLGASALGKAAVTLSGSAGQGRRRPQLMLTIRPQNIDGAPAWMANGQQLRVLLGNGENAGMLRVQPTPAGDFVMLGFGKARGGTISVRLTWPRLAKAVKHAAQPVEFDYGDDWLEVTLPDWARPPASAATHPATAAAAAEARRGAGYVSPSDRLPDPAAEDRLAARRAGGISA